MYTVVSGTSVTHEMVDEALLIDAAVYPEHLRGPWKICHAWLDRNPLIYTMLLSDGKVVGCANAMPMEDEWFEQLERGLVVDVDCPIDALRRYDEPGNYKLYFCSLDIYAEHRNPLALKKLMGEFRNGFDRLENSGIFISEVIADAVSPKGEAMCRHFGMKSTMNTKRGTLIYKSTEESRWLPGQPRIGSSMPTLDYQQTPRRNENG